MTLAPFAADLALTRQPDVDAAALPQTPVEARALILEDELQEAIATVEFLHGCLTDERYRYAYPDQTLSALERWRELVPQRHPCPHSRHTPGCASCQERAERWRRLERARGLLNADPSR